ncbi:MAG: hypothetical protein ACRD2X_05070 [Vicinamibacteraceae bacterium]
MMANAAFLAALTLLVFAGWLAEEVVFLAPYKATIFGRYGWLLGAVALFLFLTLTAVYYTVARWFGLRDTGRKLAHVDRQLASSDTLLEDLRRDLTS